jgi:hypothetical protein
VWFVLYLSGSTSVSQRKSCDSETLFYETESAALNYYAFSNSHERKYIPNPMATSVEICLESPGPFLESQCRNFTQGYCMKRENELDATQWFVEIMIRSGLGDVARATSLNPDA